MASRRFFVLCSFMLATRAVLRCGSKYNDSFCEDGDGCCSDAGFCGTTEEYCLVANGCQSNCTDGTPTPTHTALASATSSVATTSFSAATVAAAAKPPLTTWQIILIAVVGTLLIAGGLIGFFWTRHRKTKAKAAEAERTREHALQLIDLTHRQEEKMIIHESRSQLLRIAEADPRAAAQIASHIGYIGGGVGESSGTARRQLTAAPMRTFEELEETLS